MLLAAFDLLLIAACFVWCYILRFEYHYFALRDVAMPELERYLKGAAILSLVWVFRLWREGSYEAGLRGSTPAFHEVRTVVVCGFYALTTLMVISFLFRELLLSRQVYLMTAVLSTFGMVGARGLFRMVDARLAAGGYTRLRVAIVGTTQAAEEFARSIQAADGLVYVVGHFSTELEPPPLGRPNLRVLGDIREIEDIHRAEPFDKVVMASPALSGRASAGADQAVIALLNLCERNSVALYMVAGSFDIAVSPGEMSEVSGTPVIHLRDAALHPMYAVVKRGIDITIALTVLILGLPLWLLVALLIRVTSRGPVLFTQRRAGLHGVPFRMYKFRSMTADAEERLKELVSFDRLAEPVFKLRNDPRVTPIGSWLRRTGLDEIPQLLNVLKGEMSIVGPRPEEVGLVERYDGWQRRRLKARPGITGYQQITNRGGGSLAERVRCDLAYLKHQSLTFDLYVIVRTPIVMLRGSGVSY
jgi:exopolysaccharide biosynthesis polyprenyl glycosylphosphotransferase